MKSINYIIPLTLFVYSCTFSDQFAIEEVRPNIRIVDFNDSIFFNVTEQIYHNKKIYINDHKRSRIYATNTDLDKVIKVIGKQGHAPGEIGFSNSIRINNDILHVLDDKNGRLHRFNINSGKFIGDTKTPTNMHIICKFLVYDNEYATINNYDEKPPIVFFDYNGKIIKRFGSYKMFDGNFVRNRNNRILFKLDDKHIITAFVSDPIIEIYDRKGYLIKTHEITLPIIKLSHDATLKKYLKEGMDNYTSVLFKELIVGKNNIYILFYDKTSEKLNNKILEIDKRSIFDSIKINRIIQIDDGSDIKLFGGMYPFLGDTKMVIQNVVSGEIMVINI